MEDLLTYFIQVNLLLVFVYLGYILLLKNLTFYTINRIYFIIGSLYALIYPLIDIKKWLVDDSLMSVPIFWDYVPLQVVEKVSHQYSVYDILLIGVLLGATVLVFKFCVQIFSLIRIHYYSKEAKWHTYLFRDVIFPIVPFSFFNKIYVHRAQHLDNELNDIFEHENVHVKGLHTWDVLFFETLLAFCWFNPMVWLIRRVVRQNLEFLTDQHVLNKGVDRQTYQYSLLTVTKQGSTIDIGSQFNFKTLKKRIMMMNKKRSSQIELSKYVLLLPIIMMIGASFTVSKAEKKIDEIITVAKETTLDIILKKEGDLLSDETNPIILADTSKTFAVKTESVGLLLDGKLVSIEKINKINAKDIESVTVNTDNALTKKYAKNTIFNVLTKKHVGTLGTPSQFTSISYNNNKFSVSEAIVDAVNDKKGDSKIAYSVSYEGKPIVFSATNQLRTDLGNTGDTTEKKIRFRSAENLGNVFAAQPLYILNDKEISASRFSKINHNDIKSINIVKGQVAASIYGAKGKDGVISIQTKDTPISIIRKDKDSIAVSFSYTGVGETMPVQKKSSLQFRGVSSINTNNSPLFILDGVALHNNFEIQQLDPNLIENISVIKDKSQALEKYGSKADNGVIIITTKKPITVGKVGAASGINDVYPGDTKEVTVIGYGRKDADASTKDSSSGSIKEVTVIGYGKKDTAVEKK